MVSPTHSFFTNKSVKRFSFFVCKLQIVGKAFRFNKVPLYWLFCKQISLCYSQDPWLLEVVDPFWVFRLSPLRWASSVGKHVGWVARSPGQFQLLNWEHLLVQFDGFLGRLLGRKQTRDTQKAGAWFLLHLCNPKAKRSLRMNFRIRVTFCSFSRRIASATLNMTTAPSRKKASTIIVAAWKGIEDKKIVRNHGSVKVSTTDNSARRPWIFGKC